MAAAPLRLPGEPVATGPKAAAGEGWGLRAGPAQAGWARRDGRAQLRQPWPIGNQLCGRAAQCIDLPFPSLSGAEKGGARAGCRPCE